MRFKKDIDVFQLKRKAEVVRPSRKKNTAETSESAPAAASGSGEQPQEKRKKQRHDGAYGTFRARSVKLTSAAPVGRATPASLPDTAQVRTSIY